MCHRLICLLRKFEELSANGEKIGEEVEEKAVVANEDLEDGFDDTCIFIMHFWNVYFNILSFLACGIEEEGQETEMVNISKNNSAHSIGSNN